MPQDNRPWLLVVDDSDDDIVLIKRAFTKAGLPLPAIARDGPAALALLHGQGTTQRPSGLPAAVLLDLKLPGPSGIDVLQQIRQHERTRFLPVAILSTSTLPSDVRRAYASGASSYLRKPVEFEAFACLVATAAGYWMINMPAKTEGH